MQLIKYQCRKCRYVFIQLHVDDDPHGAACPRCHHRGLDRRADFAAMPPPGAPPLHEEAAPAGAMEQERS